MSFSLRSFSVGLGKLLSNCVFSTSHQISSANEPHRLWIDRFLDFLVLNEALFLFAFVGEFGCILLPVSTIEVDNFHFPRRCVYAIDVHRDSIWIGPRSVKRLNATGSAKSVPRCATIELVNCLVVLPADKSETGQGDDEMQEAVFEQIEQLHRSTSASSGAVTMNRTARQWQLPVCTFAVSEDIAVWLLST